MGKKYDFFVIGDINLDWYCPDWLPIALTEIDRNGINTYTAINETPGGSGLNFARFAREEGFKSLLFGRGGDDVACSFIEKYLQEKDINYKIFKDSTLRTGKVFIGRDMKGVRFLINEERNANRQLSESDIEQYTDLLLSAKMLYISGYCFMHAEKAPRTKATYRAIELALNSGIRIIFDVVPHQFYKFYQGDFWDLTKEMYIIISEVPTIRRYISQKETGHWGQLNEPITYELALQTAKKLKEDFGYKNFILRYGPSGCDNQITCSEYFGIEAKSVELSHDKLKDTRGLGDKLAIKALIEKFKIIPMNSV